MDILLQDDRTLLFKDRSEDFIGGQRVGQHHAHNGQLLSVTRHLKTRSGDEGFAGLTLIFLQQLVNLIDQDINLSRLFVLSLS